MQMQENLENYNFPDSSGHFGPYGGVFVPETLIHALEDLRDNYETLKNTPSFMEEFHNDLKHFVGRPSPVYYAKRLTEMLGGAQIWLKREDLNHTGAHKVNNTVGQALLARHMGKKRIIAETGAGQHGVASATVAARYGMDCVVYMGSEDIKRQASNVYRMRLLGAEVVPVESGSKTLKDALNEAMRDWSANYDKAHYLLGTAAGPHPFPTIVREFHRMIGEETRAQIMEKEGRLPDALVACVGGGSNAIGMFADFIDEPSVRLIGVEPAGKGLHTHEHGATICTGSKGILHGAFSYIMQDKDGQIEESYSVSAGLDYPAVGPQHAYLSDIGRAEYVAATDDEALNAFKLLARKEGIIPALESSHAIAHALNMADEATEETIIVVNLSGRGDKDLAHVTSILGDDI